jgi:hypothetical protein
VSGLPTIVLSEEWLACPKCDALIRMDDRVGLLDQALNSPALTGIKLRFLPIAHACFWAG